MSQEKELQEKIEVLEREMAALCACLWDAVLLTRILADEIDLPEKDEIHLRDFAGQADAVLGNLHGQGLHLAEVYVQAMSVAEVWSGLSTLIIGKCMADDFTETMEALAKVVVAVP